MAKGGYVPKTFFVITMGCQMNEYDSDFLARTLIHDGFLPSDNPESADLVLINTCTVRDKPEQKAFSALGRMGVIKRRKPDMILGMVGCLAQQYGAKLLKRFPQLDLVLGPRELSRIQDVLKSLGQGRGKVVATDLGMEMSRPLSFRHHFRGRITGSISIMNGCNNFCSYCIVPFVRGREISRPPEEILIEAENMISDGIKEIMLLGQNVNSYQWGKKDNWNFPSLIREVGKLKGLLRLRFATSHPKDVSFELIRCFRQVNTLCPHLHLPFQAGSTRILQRMKRDYTREEYMELVDNLREVRPDIAITSDVMVGFPGETEKDFEMTLDLVERIRFDALFSFKYCDRGGTLAAKMSDKVGEKEKASRLSVLQELQKRISLEMNKDLEMKQLDVLVEGQSKRGDQLTGRTGTNKVVNFTGDINKIGSLVKIKIKHGFQNSLLGEFSGDANPSFKTEVLAPPSTVYT